MKNPRIIVVLVTVVLCFAVAGVLSAQPAGPKSTNVEKAKTTMPGPMPDLSPEVHRKLIEQEIKFVKETAPLRAELEQKRLELRLLWLEETPNADKIIAKLNELNKLQMQLREKEIRNRFAASNLVPTEFRQEFLRGRGPRMGMGPGMGCGMMCGMGPRMRIEKRIMRHGPGCCEDQEGGLEED